MIVANIKVNLRSSLRQCDGRHHDYGYVPLVVSTSWSFPHSCFIAEFVIRLTRRLPLVKQEKLTLPEHLSSSPVLLGFVLLDL